MHNGVTFNFGSAKVCSPAIYETFFSYDKDIWITASDYYMHFYIIVLFLSTANKFYSFIIFSLLIDAVILLLNSRVLNTLFLHTFSFSWMLFSLFKHYLELYITSINFLHLTVSDIQPGEDFQTERSLQQGQKSNQGDTMTLHTYSPNQCPYRSPSGHHR